MLIHRGQLAGAVVLPLLFSSALAQDVVQPKEFTLTVSGAEANAIGDSILGAKGAMTPKDALDLLQKIRTQVAAQLAEEAKKQEKPAEAPK